MRYQYKREPLTGDEATRLANACNPHEEKLVVWVLLDTGLRVSELANLKRANLDWQTHRLMIYGKGGPFGTKSKRRVIPLPARIQPLIEGYFALHETFRFSVRTIQRMLKRVANRARISRTVSPHVLRHTFAVTAIQKGISLPALQRLLGHDTLLTTTSAGLRPALTKFSKDDHLGPLGCRAANARKLANSKDVNFPCGR